MSKRSPSFLEQAIKIHELELEIEEVQKVIDAAKRLPMLFPSVRRRLIQQQAFLNNRKAELDAATLYLECAIQESAVYN